MNVELKRIDLIRLIEGCKPSYTQMDNLKNLDLGTFGDAWIWNVREINKHSENGLWTLYNNIKDGLL